ncbi:MAG: hypothetical protein MZV70_36515, partial [Desulfobacterales bacterium]|nr:hypothetical protein [Desulfobacterales bacterium]
CTSFSYVLLRLNRRLQTESTAPHKAQFVLGGTIKEMAYSDEQGAFGIGVEQELLHVASKTVVYRALVRHEEIGVGKMNAQTAGNALFLGALRGLLARPKFVEALKLGPDTPRPAGAALSRPGSCCRCVAEPIDMYAEERGRPARDGGGQDERRRGQRRRRLARRDPAHRGPRRDRGSGDRPLPGRSGSRGRTCCGSCATPATSP